MLTFTLGVRIYKERRKYSIRYVFIKENINETNDKKCVNIFLKSGKNNYIKNKKKYMTPE